MTSEEAIKIIESQGAKSDVYGWRDVADAYGLAIKALKSQGRAETSQPKQTNYDKIHSMSLAELAVFLSDTTWCRRCPIDRDTCCNSRVNCIRTLATWLKKEAADERLY